MRIPITFRLFGCLYTVRIVPRAEWKDNETVGLFNAFTREIHILENDPDAIAHAYLHELQHAIMNAMGEARLYSNEKFIDLSSGLLHQALTSAEYESKPPIGES
jgi:hypothetical protein